MPPAITPKRRQKLEPITYDELLSNAGMSGFVSFLEFPTRVQPAEVEAKPAIESVPERQVSTEIARQGFTTLPQPYPAESPIKQAKPHKQGRIRKALMVEDGHSLAEQAVYEALWKASVPTSELAIADRTIRIGYHRLAQLTRLSWVSVKSNLRSLETKLAIEVIGCENSATREGKRYLVYSRPAILERRQKSGLIWVRRTRGVELLASEFDPSEGGARGGGRGPVRANNSALDAEDQDQEETPIPGAHNRSPARLF